jgi:hypothetical protein
MPDGCYCRRVAAPTKTLLFLAGFWCQRRANPRVSGSAAVVYELFPVRGKMAPPRARQEEGHDK